MGKSIKTRRGMTNSQSGKEEEDLVKRYQGVLGLPKKRRGKRDCWGILRKKEEDGVGLFDRRDENEGGTRRNFTHQGGKTKTQLQK